MSNVSNFMRIGETWQFATNYAKGNDLDQGESYEI